MADDIVLVYSGGSNNAIAELSLGGEPSGFPVTEAINNIFDNVSDEETDAGLVDYRCIYVFNNHSDASLYNIKVYLNSQVDGGATVQIGISKATEIQRISILGQPLGGSFTISYQNDNVIVPYNSDPGIWATSLQDGLNALDTLSGIIVNASVSTNLLVFEIRFEGDDNFKSHELIQLEANHLTNSPSIVISELVMGSPTNSIAPDIEFDTVIPFGVTFTDTNKTSPLTLDLLLPDEGFPLWFKRTTAAGTAATTNDGFNLIVSVSPIP